CARHRLTASARIAVPLSAAILASTLYLRYHYLVDVLAGAVLGVGAGAAAAGWMNRAAARTVPATEAGSGKEQDA
ncbi:MAG: phosphatase PAP2 family protein, partial [Planctomycetota bacterium]